MQVMEACRVLGVSEFADADEVRRAYETLACCHDPANEANTREYLRIRSAYETVCQTWTRRKRSRQALLDGHDASAALWLGNPEAAKLFLEISENMTPEQSLRLKRRVARLVDIRRAQRERRLLSEGGIGSLILLTILCALLSTSRIALTAMQLRADAVALQFGIYLTLNVVAGSLAALAGAWDARGAMKSYRIVVLFVTLMVWLGDYLERLAWLNPI
jgi:hypothetical protein